MQFVGFNFTTAFKFKFQVPKYLIAFGVLALLVQLSQSAPSTNTAEVILIPKESSSPFIVLEFQEQVKKGADDNNDSGNSSSGSSSSESEEDDNSSTTEFYSPELKQHSEETSSRPLSSEDHKEKSHIDDNDDFTLNPLKQYYQPNNLRLGGEASRVRRDTLFGTHLPKDEPSSTSAERQNETDSSPKHGLDSDEVKSNKEEKPSEVIFTRISIFKIIRLPFNDSNEDSSEAPTTEATSSELQSSTTEKSHIFHVRAKRQTQLKLGYADDSAHNARAIEASPEALKANVTAPTFVDESHSTPSPPPAGTSSAPPPETPAATTPSSGPAASSAPVSASSAGTSAQPPTAGTVQGGPATTAKPEPFPVITSASATSAPVAPAATSSAPLICPAEPAGSSPPPVQPAPSQIVNPPAATTSAPQGKSNIGYN